MSDAQSLYVDDAWFKKTMKEKKWDPKKQTNIDLIKKDFKNYSVDVKAIKREAKNYPVEVKAIKIRWFINSKYGKEFLVQILKNENLEIYNIQTLRIIIEYFYGQYINFLFQRDLPLFILKAVVFLATMGFNELLR